MWTKRGIVFIYIYIRECMHCLQNNIKLENVLFQILKRLALLKKTVSPFIHKYAILHLNTRLNRFKIVYIALL